MKTTVIIGSGPSAIPQQIGRCLGRPHIIVINHAFRLAPWAHHLHAGDARWWTENIQDAQNFRGIRSTMTPHLPEAWGVRVFEESPNGRFDWGGRIAPGKDSAFQALQIAVLDGAERILLVGIDLRQGWRGESHNHDYYNDDSPIPRPVPDYPGMIAHWRELAPHLKKAGVHVLNCSPISALDCFERARLEDVPL